MNYEEFLELIESRQATRSFSGKEIEKDVLEKIVSAARLAPSACNSQPWKMYVVTDKEKVAAVAKTMQNEGKNSFLSEAKAFIVLSEVVRPLLSTVKNKNGNAHFVKYDVGELAAYVTLAAKAAGVDSCIIGWIDVPALKKELNMTDEEDCSIAVALGYGDKPLRDKIRLPEKDTVKFI